MLFVVIPIASAQISDRTGLKQNFIIETGGYEFPVDVISNFNIENFDFNSQDKQLTFYINSGLENNLAELQIPINLINGNFTFYLNDQEILPTVKQNERISFIILEFQGTGKHKLDIIGTTYLPEFSEIAHMILALSFLSVIFLIKGKKLNFYNYSFNRDWIKGSNLPFCPNETSLRIPFLSTTMVEGVPCKEYSSKVSAEYSLDLR